MAILNVRRLRTRHANVQHIRYAISLSTKKENINRKKRQKVAAKHFGATYLGNGKQRQVVSTRLEDTETIVLVCASVCRGNMNQSLGGRRARSGVFYTQRKL